jgi:hypothetical protein
MPTRTRDTFIFYWLQVQMPDGEEAVKRAYKDFTSKHRATAHLRETPHTLD